MVHGTVKQNDYACHMVYVLFDKFEIQNLNRFFAICDFVRMYVHLKISFAPSVLGDLQRKSW